MKEEHAIDIYLRNHDWRLKENANHIFCVGHLMNYLSTKYIYDYWLNNVMTEKIRNYHKEGKVHLHDLSRITPYCSGFSTGEVVKKGLKGPKGRINSIPPKHLSSAINQLTNFVGVMSQEFAGAIALNDFSLYLAPFVYYDRLTYKQVKQEVQQFVFHMNQPNRWAGECPFSNVTINLTVPEDLKNNKVVISGEEKSKTYGDFEDEMNMINEALLEVLIEGDASGTPMTFPVVTIGVDKNFPWESEIAKKIFQVTAKYGTPFFENFGEGTGRDPKDSRSMCPLKEDTRVIVKDRKNIKSIEISKLGNKEKSYEVLSDGTFKKGSFIKVPSNELIEITLSNNQKLVTTPEHLNFTYEGTKKSSELKTDDYLPYSLDGYGEENLKGYDIGYLIGCYIGDGSKTDSNVTFSLSENKLECVNKLNKILKYNLGLSPNIYIEKDGKLISLFVTSPGLSKYIKDFIEETSALNKSMTYKVFTANRTFRKGILDGWYDTDGGNSNRIYTSSELLKENFIDLCASIGTVASINEDDRIIEDKYRLPSHKYDSGATSYVLRFYNRNTLLNKNYGSVYKKDYNNRNICWFKIKNIKKLKINANKNCYCFQMENEPKFTLASGIITHNCRLNLDQNELRKHTGGLFGSGDSMGSIAVATINLNRIGYEAKNEEEYFKKLEETMKVCKDALELRRNKINEMYDIGLYPYTKFYLKNYKTYFSTIGIIGGNESMLNFIKKDLTQSEALDFMNKVLDFMNNKCKEFQKETGNLYNLEAVPGEGCMYSLALKDKEHCKDIIVSGTKEPYLTTAALPPVEETDFLKTIKTQENLQIKYSGGTTMNIYIGEKLDNYKQAKNIVKKIIENTKIPYFSITPTYSICKDCGYISGEKYTCPDCGKNTEVFSRVVGYLKPKNRFNNGKKEEFRKRKYFNLNEINKIEEENA